MPDERPMELADDDERGIEMPWAAWNLGRGWILFVPCLLCGKWIALGPFQRPETTATAAEAAEGAVCRRCAETMGLA